MTSNGVDYKAINFAILAARKYIPIRTGPDTPSDILQQRYGMQEDTTILTTTLVVSRLPTVLGADLYPSGTQFPYRTCTE